MSKFTKRAGATLAVSQQAQWLFTGGVTAVLSGVAAVTLRIIEQFTWGLVATFAVGFALLAYTAVLILIHASQELRIVLAARPGSASAQVLPRGVRRTVNASMTVTNLSTERATELLKVRMASGPKLVSRPFVHDEVRRGDDDETGGTIRPDETVSVLCQFMQDGLGVDAVQNDWSCKSRLVLTDRFGKRYRTPRITFSYKGKPAE